MAKVLLAYLHHDVTILLSTCMFSTGRFTLDAMRSVLIGQSTLTTLYGFA
jgi:hypothetical protein